MKDKQKTNQPIDEVVSEIKEKVKSASEKWEEESCCHNSKHQGSIFWAFFFIILGTVFLLNNFGILPWGVWGSLWHFWPLILIFMGLKMVFGKGILGNFLISVIGIIILLIIFTSAAASYNSDIAFWLQSNLPGLNQIMPKNFFNKEFDRGVFFQNESHGCIKLNGQASCW